MTLGASAGDGFDGARQSAISQRSAARTSNFVPAGRYTVTAERNGKTLHHAVRVNHRGDKLVNFHWPSA